MERIEKRKDLQARADALRAEGKRIALVPTMGALHRGHLSLVETARRHADEVWVSIFVNPTQFNEAADFEGYPVQHEEDWAACLRAGVDRVYLPAVEDLYPGDATTWVDVEELTSPLCGAGRPGHFRGVTTVVAKLLVAAKPHVAVFGEKDYQQLAVVRRMVRDLGLDVEIHGSPTVREADGLALSSRNVRLGPAARRAAPVLAQALDAAQHEIAQGERLRDRILARVQALLEEAPGAAVEYAELRDPESLAPAPEKLSAPTLLALAVHFGADADGRGEAVRLIDNRVLCPGEPQAARDVEADFSELEERP